MIEMTRVRFLKYVIGAMVDVDMNLTPLGRRLIYELKVYMGYRRILDPKGV
jgi:hypothetical protein